MTTTEKYDAILIGAGQANNPLAGALAQNGWNLAIIDREHVGGTCINEGCTPTKTMIASAQDKRTCTSAAVSMARRVEDNVPTSTYSAYVRFSRSLNRVKLLAARTRPMTANWAFSTR